MGRPAPESGARIKGPRYPLGEQYRQKVISDGSLTLRHNHLDQALV
jgi:hypothetical protein